MSILRGDADAWTIRCLAQPRNENNSQCHRMNVMNEYFNADNNTTAQPGKFIHRIESEKLLKKPYILRSPANLSLTIWPIQVLFD